MNVKTLNLHLKEHIQHMITLKFATLYIIIDQVHQEDKNVWEWFVIINQDKINFVYQHKIPLLHILQIIKVSVKNLLDRHPEV